MIDLIETLRELVALFERLEAPYAVMGGLAVRVYGIPRPTHDIDFTLAVARAQLPDLYAALRGLGYAIPEPHESGWVDRVAGMPVVKARLYLESQGIDIDLFLAESPFQEELLARRRREQIDDVEVSLISPEDLILLKLVSHRPRDMADIGDILFVQGELDESHLRRWADALQVRAELERVLRERAT